MPDERQRHDDRREEEVARDGDRGATAARLVSALVRLSAAIVTAAVVSAVVSAWWLPAGDGVPELMGLAESSVAAIVIVLIALYRRR